MIYFELGKTARVPGAVTPDWGLHLVDVNVAMGNLIALVETQGKAWRATQ